ncbi:MAG: tetratricopeptide repeat protein [Merismopedia sp. SIO2A8]|nr:tetratricopeptide repeat protein [Symploca sp. SIO2B6]NET50889.1 tetratricopeptide repeat protein [Merismopedia sp. SIO2A8]
MNAHLVLEEKPIRQDQKLKTLTKYVQQYPSGWKKRLELARLLYTMGRWQQASQEYRQVLKQQTQLPLIEVRLELGKILQLMARETEAIEVYENTLLLCRNLATQHHLGGLIELCRHCPQKAASMFSLAASTQPDNKAHWLALGQVYLDTESPLEALNAFNQALEVHPDDFLLLRNSYQALMAVGNFQEAGRRLSRALELVPDDFLTLKQLADYRTHQGLVRGEEGKQTKQMIRVALRVAPDSADAHESLAHYHLFRGEWKKTIALCRQFTEKHPHSPSGWYYYGQYLFHTGEYQDAAEAILKAYGLHQNYCEIYRALCEILPAAGITASIELFTQPFSDKEGSKVTLASILEEMLERFPERWSVWATVGRVLVESFQDIERGCSLSAKGRQLQPQLADAWFCHGRVLALAQRHQEAVEALKQGWQLLPPEGGYLQSVPAAVWLGESYRLLGDDTSSWRWYQEACERAKKLMAFNPATAYYWQGRALSELGDVSGAIEAYQNALSQQLLYPARGEVEDTLQRLQTMA